MKTTLILAALSLGALGACTAVSGTTASYLHPQVDQYCLQPLAVRQTARATFGTTAAGNQIQVECAADAAP